jgi:hypothetical protein
MNWPSFCILSKSEHHIHQSQNNVVGIENRLQAQGSRVPIPAGARDFSLLPNVQVHSVAHPASHSMGIGILSYWYSNHGMKLTIHLHLVSQLRMSGATPLPPYAFMVWTEPTLPLLYPSGHSSTSPISIIIAIANQESCIRRQEYQYIFTTGNIRVSVF